MLAEIKKIGEFLRSDKNARDIRDQIFLILAIFIALLLVNRFVLGNLADRAAFYLSIVRTKIAFTGNASVYPVEINPETAELAKVGIESLNTSTPFYLPLFSLIFYFPFSLINNFDWSLAFWMTTNQILIFFIVREFLDVVNWEIKEKCQYFAALSALVCYFVFFNYINTNLSLIQLFLIVLSLKKIKTREFIFAGVLFGFAMINPYQFLIPFIILVLLNLINRRGAINSWMIITIILLSLFMVIFDMRWVLENLRVLLLESTIYPAISYGDYLSGVFPGINKNFFEVIPIFVFSWLVIEWLRMPKENFLQELWIISLAFTLNTMLHSWNATNTLSAYILVTIFTTSLWFNRSTVKFKYFSFILYAIVLIIIPIILIVVNKGVIDNSLTFWINGVFYLITIINLYWVRLWVVNPYYAVNSVDEGY